MACDVLPVGMFIILRSVKIFQRQFRLKGRGNLAEGVGCSGTVIKGPPLIHFCCLVFFSLTMEHIFHLPWHDCAMGRSAPRAASLRSLATRSLDQRPSDTPVGLCRTLASARPTIGQDPPTRQRIATLRWGLAGPCCQISISNVKFRVKICFPRYFRSQDLLVWGTTWAGTMLWAAQSFVRASWEKGSAEETPAKPSVS